MDDEPIVVTLIEIGEDGAVLIHGVFGPFESEEKASQHMRLFAPPEKMMKRRNRPGMQILISQEPVEDPSAFAERLDELLDLE